jgi:hypothetical protein
VNAPLIAAAILCFKKAEIIAESRNWRPNESYETINSFFGASDVGSLGLFSLK